ASRRGGQRAQRRVVTIDGGLRHPALRPARSTKRLRGVGDEGDDGYGGLTRRPCKTAAARCAGRRARRVACDAGKMGAVPGLISLYATFRTVNNFAVDARIFAVDVRIWRDSVAESSQSH